MSDNDQIDDQTLGAFVDGQLDAESRRAVIDVMCTDPDVRARVRSLWKSKELMWAGFGEARSRRKDTTATVMSGGWLRYAAAVFVILICASVLGAYLGYREGIVVGHRENMASQAQEQAERIILHISKSDRAQFKAAMDFVRKFLEKHPAGSGDIAVIANAGGLDLLRSGVTPYEKEITEMASAHVNVHFVACAQSIRNLRSQGIEPKFLPSVDESLPAFDQIIRRVEDGWRYMSVESLMKTS